MAIIVFGGMVAAAYACVLRGVMHDSLNLQLHEALSSGDVSESIALLEGGADPNATDYGRATSAGRGILYSVRCWFSRATRRTTVSRGCPNAIESWYGPYGGFDSTGRWTFTDVYPVRPDCPRLMIELIRHGFDPRATCSFGSVLAVASAHHHPKSVMVFLQGGAVPLVKFNCGANPLTGSDMTSARELLSCGARVLDRDFTGRTPLDYPDVGDDYGVRSYLLRAAREQEHSR